MLNSKLRASKILDNAITAIGRQRLQALSDGTSHDQRRAAIIKDVADYLDASFSAHAKQVDRYIERLEIEAEVLERLQRRITTEIEQVRSFRTRGEPRLEYDVKAQVLKLITSITQEVKIDAAKGR
jgi:DNA repair ATPase RecN